MTVFLTDCVLGLTVAVVRLNARLTEVKAVIDIETGSLSRRLSDVEARK
jgi:hypothetical protein